MGGQMDRNGFEDQFFITYGWMADLGLSKAEQTILAIAYNFQISKTAYYYNMGNGQHLAKWIHGDVGDVIDAIKHLIELDLVRAFSEDHSIYLYVKDPRISNLANYKNKYMGEKYDE